MVRVARRQIVTVQVGLPNNALAACRTFGATPVKWSKCDQFRWSYANFVAFTQIERLRIRVGTLPYAKSDRLLAR